MFDGCRAGGGSTIVWGCERAIVSKGRMIGKKRGTTLDFTMKVIIFVCTLVNVYNMKKKRELIVTVVSITSLYF